MGEGISVGAFALTVNVLRFSRKSSWGTFKEISRVLAKYLLVGSETTETDQWSTLLKWNVLYGEFQGQTKRRNP